MKKENKGQWGGWADFLGTLGSGNHTWSKQAILSFLKEFKDGLEKLSMSQILLILSDSNALNILKIEGLKDAIGLPPIERKEKINAIIKNREKEILNNPEECDVEEVQEDAEEKDTQDVSLDKLLIESSKDESESIMLGTNKVDFENFIKILDTPQRSFMTDETINALVSIESNKLLNGLLNKQITINEIKQILKTKSTNQTAIKVTNFVRDKFIKDYEAALKLDLKGYKGPYGPRPMQLVFAYMSLTRKALFNLSLGGTGKTLAAILTARVLNSKMTVLICLNSTLDQWKDEILEAYPDAKVYFKDELKKIKNEDSFKWLILNYEAFQGEDGKLLNKYIVENLDVDYIVADEVHKAKQRDEDKFSSRKDTIASLISLCRYKNKELRVVGMTATPILNNLTEFKYLLEMIIGENYSEDSQDLNNPYSSLKTKFSLPNAFEMYKHATCNSIRCELKLDLKFKQTIITHEANHLLSQILVTDKKGRLKRIKRGLEYEQITLDEKLIASEKYLKKGQIIYTLYVEGEILPKIKAFAETRGFSVGFYTGDDKSGLDAFKRGNIDILIASSAIGTGIDGIQKVSNGSILLSIPHTYGDYLQFIWRFKRVHSNFKNIEFFIPQITINYQGQEVSVDKYRMARINLKKNISDAAIDGQHPNINPDDEEKLFKLCVDKLNDLIEAEENRIYNIFRERLPVNIQDISIEDFKRQRHELGDLSEFHRLAKTSKSSTIHKKLIENPQLFFNYHNLRDESRKSWSEQPYEYIATKIKNKNHKVIDFGCGMNQFRNCIPKNKVISFDHVSCDDSVIACDMKDVSKWVDNESVDVCVFSLALWGTNHKEYIKEAYRVLNYGGVIHIAEPAKDYTTPELEQELKALIEEVGFKVVGDIERRNKFIYITGIKM